MFERFDLTKLVDDVGVDVSYNDHGEMVLNFATGATTTSTSGISSVQDSILLKDILKAAQEKTYFLDVVYQSDAGIKQKAKTVDIPVSTSNVSFTEFTSEASARTMTQIDNLSTVQFTYSLKKYGASIAKNVTATSPVDVVKFAREQLIYDVSSKLDSAIATALAGASSPAATLIGGGKANVASLAAGDTLTPELIADAITELKKQGWSNEKDKPFVLFISPAQENALLKSPQFTNASEYGSNEVVLNGEIGKYLGAKVISTTRVPAKTTGDGWGADGHQCLLVKAKVCAGLVWFEKPTLDGEYKKDEAMTNIYLDTSYDVKALNEKAIVVINVTDA